MFGFEGLEIYKRSRKYNQYIRKFLKRNKLDYATENQQRRASLSVVLNIAEGAARFSKLDIRRFYVMSRSSVHECVANLDILHEERSITNELFESLYKESEELSKMLYKMIRDLSN